MLIIVAKSIVSLLIINEIRNINLLQQTESRPYGGSIVGWIRH